MSHGQRVWSAALVGLVFTAATAQAQLSVVDQKCRDALAKAFSKTVSTAEKVSSGCHKGRNAGKLADTTDCNDLSPGQADSRSKLVKAKAKLEAAVAKSCTSAGASDAVLDHFVSCPEPCGTTTGVSNPLGSYPELGTCLACLAGDVVERRNTVLLGNPAAPMASSQSKKCHRTITKSHGRHLKTLLKERQACQKSEDRLGNDELQPCDAYDLDAKIADAAAAAAAAVQNVCAGVNLSDVDSCSTTDVASLNACLAAESSARGSDAFAAGYQTAGTICPVRIDLTVLSGPGTRTFTDTGWTGLAHRIHPPQDYVLSLDVTCPSAGPCDVCTVDGISSAGPQFSDFTRCRYNPTIPCDEPFGPDVDDCAGVPISNECAVFFGPPVPHSIGLCSLDRLSGDVTGTVNPDDGSWELSVAMNSRPTIGDSITRPCAVCSGDTTPQDGLRDGVCVDGSNSGGACDTQAFDPTFAKQADGVGLSTDCPPHLMLGLDPPGVQISLGLATGDATLATTTGSCDAPFTGLDCWCGACSGDPTQACHTNADCATTGTGTCTKGSGPTRQPNDCSDLTCVAIADEPAGNNRGQCNLASDTLTYCDGVVRSDGRGYIGCSDDAECDAYDCNPATPMADGCGDCTLSERRACFLDPIEATGDPDTTQPLLVSTFCVPSHSFVFMNANMGLPGPARAGIEASVQLVY